VPPLPQPQTDLLFNKYYSPRLPNKSIKTNFQQASLRSSILKQAAQNPGKPEIFLTKHKSTTLQAAGTTSSSSSSSTCSCKSTFLNKETNSTKPKTRKFLTKHRKEKSCKQKQQLQIHLQIETTKIKIFFKIQKKKPITTTTTHQGL
jgi:hypothetical protein